MYQQDDIDWGLLDRYAADEATADETLQVERWLAADPRHGALLAAMRTGTAGERWRTQQAWSAVRARAGLASAQRRAARRWYSAPLLRAAAALVLLAGGTLLVQSLRQPAASGGAATLLSVVTARSESDTIRLDDGSEIILAAASRLEHPASFAATSREVRLTGEALFRVVSDPSRPFRVQAGRTTVRVVGTQFVTRAPANGRDVTVAVVEGAVAVSGGTGEVMVRPGQVARVSADGTQQVRDADIEPYLAWTEGRLVFDDAAVTDVFAELQRWYRVEFRAEAEIEQRRVTARLRAESLDETVAALALALGANHRRSNDTITFTPK